MLRPLFPAHGAYSLAIDGRILHMRAFGPWNEELTYQYGKDVRRYTDALAGAPWALLAEVMHDGVHTPESFRLQLEITRAHQEIGRIATAVIFDYENPPQIAQRVFDKLYDQAGEPHAFFDDQAAARAWLLEQLQLAEGGSNEGRS